MGQSGRESARREGSPIPVASELHRLSRTAVSAPASAPVTVLRPLGPPVRGGLSPRRRRAAAPRCPPVRTTATAASMPLPGPAASVGWVQTSQLPSGRCSASTPAFLGTGGKSPSWRGPCCSGADSPALSVGEASATETGDYTENSGTLAFAPGGRGKTITVATIADADTDEETFTLTLSGESNVTLAVGQFQTGSGKNMQMLGQLFTGESVIALRLGQ